MKSPMCLLIVSIAVVASAYGATYYVDASVPNDAGSGTTPAKAKHTVTAALALCNPKGGDTVIVMDGTYRDAGDQIGLEDLPANASDWTVIKAQNTWGPVIMQPLSCNADRKVRNFVALEGLRFCSLSKHSFAGSHWKITKCAFYGQLIMGNNTSSQSGLRCESILVEDCHVWGPGAQNQMRYKVQVYNSSQVILRRVVARHDGGYTSVGVTNPSAVFMVYSSQSVRLQNCIAIDSPGAKNDHWSGGYYTADHRSNDQLLWQDVKWQGCISMSIQGTAGFMIDNKYNSGGYSTEYDNCIALNGDSYAFCAWNNYNPGVPLIYSQCSVINKVSSSADERGFYQGGYSATVRYSIVLNQKGEALRGIRTTQYNNAYGCGTTNPGTNGLTTNPLTNGLKYPVRIESGSVLATAGNGSRIGADVTKTWGASGSMWGEDGFETPTSDALWPFPFESYIKEDFTAYNNVSNEQRGFCADGNGLYGGPITLTSYIWESLGNPLPDEIYNGPGLVMPLFPTNLQGIAVSSYQGKGGVNFIMSLPRDGQLSLLIHDILGRKIWEYKQGIAQAGTYRIGWHGGALVSGLHFLVLKQGDKQIFSRLAIVR